MIKELFTRDGHGTMITDAHYEEVRMANIGDVGGLINLLRPLEDEGILVYRSRERLEMKSRYLPSLSEMEPFSHVLHSTRFLQQKMKSNQLKLPV